METSENMFSELVDSVKSWLPWRTEPANVSRDFWMPDHSCRVCYECDSQFTIFNRRHHCRLCGRVFCAKCTANSIPAPSDDPKCKREDWERIRVCNYCFKQWQQGTPPVDDGIQLSSPGLSPSPSAMSLASMKSSITGNSISTIVSSSPYLNGPYQRAQYGSCLGPVQSSEMEPGSVNQDILTSGRDMNSVADIGDPPNQFGFCINRSDDDDDDEYCLYRSDSETRQFQPSDYYGPIEIDDIDHGYRSHSLHLAEGSIDTNDNTYGEPERQDSQASLETEKIEGAGHDNGDECDGASPMYGVESTNTTEPVDFENNGLLWLPPEPEDEEDDREAVLFDDDDDEDATGEWKTLRSSGSFGSGEYRSRDRSSEEHRNAMKNVVEGHFRALVAQLLQAENLCVGEESGNESWLDIITSLSWEAATLLKPDMSKGGGMDPGGYVKVKCIACGHRSESMVIKGVVCKKNVAHRRMISNIKSPRFLILGGALEYQRVTNNLSSFDTLLQQEMDHLKMAVAKIDAHHPDILLVEKSVSRYAQEYLLAKGISLVLNMKRPLLDRIARCTGAQIVPSIDHLLSQKLGHCEIFHVEKFLEGHGSAGQGGKKLVKTLMFFEGCPRPLGYTVLLKGANGDELKKVKHVLQYGVFAAYHLALETSFLADEGATLQELPMNSPITVALPNKSSSVERSISTIPGFTVPASSGKAQLDIQRPNTIHVSDPSLQPSNPLISTMGMEATPHAFQSPYSQITETNTSSVDLTQLPDEKGFPAPHVVCKVCVDPVSPVIGTHRLSSNCAFEDQNKVGFEHYEDNDRIPVNGYGTQVASDDGVLGLLAENSQINDRKMMGNQQDFSDFSSFHQDNLHDDRGPSKEEFPPSPSDHQSILVSLSTRCVWKGTVCERAHLLRIKYYGSFDKPLGRFLRDHLFDQSFQCHLCEMPAEAHVHCYTHRQGSLTISVKKMPEFLLPGEREGKIWMWHRCLRCPRTSGFPPATRRVVMSDAAWGLSFGKFLELSFSNHAAASRVASCGHSLHRDCLRFYGFGKMVACFRYASIDVHSVYLPPSKLDFNYQCQDWIQKEADEVAYKSRVLFTEVVNSLCQITEKRLGSGSVGSGMDFLESRRAELETALQMERTKFEVSLQKAVNTDPMKGHPAIDILEINCLWRQLLAYSYACDRCLILFANLDNGLHLEVIGSIAQQEKPDPIEKPAECNSFSKTNGNFSNSHSLPPGLKLDVTQKVILHSVDSQGGIVDQDLIDKIESTVSVSTIMTASDQSQLLDSCANVRRAFSDSKFPTMENLSDTLDAVWTGTSLAGTVMPLENGSGPSNSPIFNSSASEALMHDTEKDSCNIKEEEAEARSFVPVMPIKGADHEDAFTNWTAALNFYHASNKNSHINSPTFEALGEYNPMYVSSFRELERQGGARLRLPVGISDTVVPVYDDEPTSIISHALISKDYHSQMLDERDKPKDSLDSLNSLSLSDIGALHSFQSFDESISETFRSLGSTEDTVLSTTSGSRSSLVMDPLLYTKALHVKVSFTDENSPLGKVKHTVTCYYAKRFDTLRRACCPSELDFIRSLSRCKKWGAQGGKSNVFFAKTLDDRFIIKQVTKTELESFIKFAPSYFGYLSESIDTKSPTCLAKILGIYQVTSKHLKGGKESRMDLLVMENLLFGRNIVRLYDLKGSSRSRYNPDANGSNKVLLDQNLIEAMPTSPIFVGNKAKRLLERAVWNDTSFLASIDVMDYSLLVGVDEEKHELVLGIIDFMRQYTWDKHLETWVKASVILGGPKNSTPTVISPMQYKKRFRKAMSAYFLMVPDQWSPSTIIPNRSLSDLVEENLQGFSVE